MDYVIQNISSLRLIIDQFFSAVEPMKSENGMIEIPIELINSFKCKCVRQTGFIEYLLKDMNASKKAELQRKYARTSEKLLQLLPGLAQEILNQFQRDDLQKKEDEQAQEDDDAQSMQRENAGKCGSKGQSNRHRGRKKGSSGTSLSKRNPHLRVEEVYLTGAGKCTECGGNTSVADYYIKEFLVHRPAEVYIKRVYYPKTRCNICQNESRVHVSDCDEPVIIKNSCVSLSFLLFIITEKFLYYMPGYRLEDKFKAMGLAIPRNQIAEWIIKASKKLMPLYELMKERLRTNPLVNMDETRLQVHKEKGRENTKISWLWLAVGRGAVPLAVFLYDPSRSADVIEKLLGPNWSGRMQRDDYSAYEAYDKRSQGEITPLSCLAHVRRKFVTYVQGKVFLPGDVYTIPIIECIGEIYDRHDAIAVRSVLSPANPAEIVRLKHENIGPLLDRLESLLLKARELVPPGARQHFSYARAVEYAIAQIPGQRNYLDDPIASPDNNICERIIKNLVIGRKNWLFADSPDGATAIAVFYSLIASAKLNDVDPRAYLEHVLKNIIKADTQEKLEALLPGSVDLPATCVVTPEPVS